MNGMRGIDRAAEPVAGGLEADSEPEGPGERVRRLKVDRDGVVTAAMGPLVRGVGEGVTDALASHGWVGGRRSDVGLAARTEPWRWRGELDREQPNVVVSAAREEVHGAVVE